MTAQASSFVGRLATADGAAGVVRLRVADGRIVTIEDEGPDHPDAGNVLRPGLMDLQVNGIGPHDLTTAPGQVWAVGRALAREGVTAFLPTLVSPRREQVAEAVAVLAAGAPAGWVGAMPLGWHLEGPFLAPGRRGAHPTDALRPVDPAEVASWHAPHVRVVTLAPELPRALEAVEALVARGVVVAAGHTDASEQQATAAFDAGVRLVTHWGNAMAPLHHRAPGLAGAALVDDRVTVGVIADGHHLASTTLALLDRVAGTRVVLVSDRVATTVSSGRLAGREVTVTDGAVRMADGRLAGAASPLGTGVAVWGDAIGRTAEQAWTAASTRPAAVLGLAQAAGLVVGAPADLVVVDEVGAVRATVVGGVVVHAA